MSSEVELLQGALDLILLRALEMGPRRLVGFVDVLLLDEP
jgi:hypothetical protein